MRHRTLAVVQLALAAVALVGAVWSWLAAGSVEVVAPVLTGEPSKSTVVYSPGLLALALLLASVGGVLVVAGVARLRAH